MDFFEHQDRARKSSIILVVLFVLALICVVISTYLLIGAAFYFSNRTSDITNNSKSYQATDVFTDWRMMLAIGGGTLLFVGGASAYRVASLSGGGEVIASSLGGRPLQPDTTDLDERRILNVVEEMAIASGIPVPPVYLLEEKGINAFAAGYSPQDAVIGVTRGCVEAMNRDQLQGVIAHEFSHILNGDMRLNIRLIALVYGVMAIGYIGAQLFRLSMYSGGSNRRGKDSGGSYLLIIGAGLFVIGIVGTFFGNLIKASLSRQREYLADASAVQFTRNPSGIAGALKQIGANSEHGEITNSSAAEFSHMYFANAVSGFFATMFSTHPPLEKRIKRIEPNWDGKYPIEKRSKKRPISESGADSAKSRADSMREKVARSIPILMGVEAIGQPTPSHLQLAHQLIEEIPDPVKEAARNPYGSRAIMYALLLNHQPTTRQAQLDQLKQRAERGLADMTEALAKEVSKLDRQHRLPLAEMTLGSLKMLSTTQLENFMANLDVLINADNRIDIFEWAVLRTVNQLLGSPKKSRVKYHSLEKLIEHTSLLISALAWAGQKDPAEVNVAFDDGTAAIGIPGMSLVSKDQISLSKLDQALDELDSADMPAKKKLITACAKCITADKRVTNNEAELMRVIAASLGCPMPPLSPGQSLA